MTQWNGKITMNGKNEANKNGRYNYGYNWNTGIQIKSLELKLRSLALSSTYSPIPSAFFRKCEIMRGKNPYLDELLVFFFFWTTAIENLSSVSFYKTLTFLFVHIAFLKCGLWHEADLERQVVL